MLRGEEQRTVPIAEGNEVARVAWLSFIGKLSQRQIADHLGLSRAKVSRLVSKAIDSGIVRFHIDHLGEECACLEAMLESTFSLRSCYVAPSIPGEVLPLNSLASAGAALLHRLLDDKQWQIVGVGHGRTLAATVEALPKKTRRHLRFVSLLGCLSRVGAADPLDVIHHLSRVTASECYYLPAPLFVASVRDRNMLVRQDLACKALQMGRQADLCVIGIGDLGKKSHLYHAFMITTEERAELLCAGAVGDILGCFIDSAGKPVQCTINRRAITAGLDGLRRKRVLAIAGGKDKVVAVTAALRSGAITDLVTDEETAQAIVQSANSQGALLRQA